MNAEESKVENGCRKCGECRHRALMISPAFDYGVRTRVCGLTGKAVDFEKDSCEKFNQ